MSFRAHLEDALAARSYTLDARSARRPIGWRNSMSNGRSTSMRAATRC